MRIPNDTEALMRTVTRHWQQQQQIVASSSARIATGTRLVSAVDDAAGVAIAERVRSQFESLYQAGRNAQNGINFVEIAQGSLSQMTDLVQRMRVFALQSANGAYDDGQRGFLQRATVLTLDELDALSRRSHANDVNMLDGSRSNLRIQNGANAGDGFDIALRAADSDSIGLGDLSVATQDDAVSALDRLDEALEVLFEHRAELAAAQNRMASAIKTLGVSAENTQATHARISDADIGHETVRMLRAEIASQAGAAMMVQVRQATETVMQLLLPEPPPLTPDASGSAGVASPGPMPASVGMPSMPSMPVTASMPTMPLPSVPVGPTQTLGSQGPMTMPMPVVGAAPGAGDPAA